MNFMYFLWKNFARKNNGLKYTHSIINPFGTFGKRLP